MLAAKHRQVVIDLAIGLLIVVMAGAWGGRFWGEWVANGGRPLFYQTYFEPAVMIACGKGFVISQVPRPQPLEDFLYERRDRLECSELPADLPVGGQYLFQGAWRYLMTTVGWSWRLTGISWSGMGPLFGLFFGVVVGLAYGVFRIGMGRVLAVFGALLMAMSTLNLVNLPHLRDYSKAPFTIALALLIGLLLTQAFRRATVLWLAAACGLVLGLGYGFRTDSLVNIPIPIIALLAFLPGGFTRNLGVKAAAVAIYVVTFVVVSWPITSKVYTSGGCQWHVTLLGLQSPFDNVLRVRPAPYDFGYAYSDSFIDRTINGYRWRQQPGIPQLIYCSAEYDTYSGAYYRHIVTTFPADILTRAYSSVLQMIELPFHQFQPPISAYESSRLYRLRAWLLEPEHRWGLAAAGAAVVMAGTSSLRLALALALLLAYFCGYPSIQFQQRHFFHLEFAGFFILGFVIQQLINLVLDWRRIRTDWKPIAISVAKSSAFAAGIALAFLLLLVIARSYQDRQAHALFAAYIAAPKEQLPAWNEPIAGLKTEEWPQLIEVDLHASACGPEPAVTFRYDRSTPTVDFTRTVRIPRPSAEPGVTRIFQPVYETYRGIDVSSDNPGCIAGVYRVRDVRAFDLLLGATLPPEWESTGLYQRIDDWERTGR